MASFFMGPDRQHGYGHLEADDIRESIASKFGAEFSHPLTHQVQQPGGNSSSDQFGL